MRPRIGFLIGAVVFALVGGLLIWLMSIASPHEKTIDLGPSDKALGNPWLAAEEYLRGRGLSVQRSETLGGLANEPNGKQTLLLFASRKTMTPQQVDRLLAWVQAGGGLVAVAEERWNKKTGRSGDLLMDRLQVEKYLTDDLEDDNTGKPEDDQPDPYPKLTKLYLENEKTPAYAGFLTGYHLYDAGNQADAWANSAGATHMLQIPYGNGWIAVVSDSMLWQNNHIGEVDNAWLLWYLAQDSQVTLLGTAVHASLLTLLLHYFPQAFVALALLLALGLWSRGMRQGPMVPEAAAGHREWREHLLASADFLLRRGGQHLLLQALQQDVLRLARRRHPGFEYLNVADQWQVLSRLSRQPTSAISQALRPRPKERLSSADFSRQVAHLQTLRNAL